VRLIAGDVDGHQGPGATHSPMAMAHVTLAAGARITLPWPEEFNALVYVLGGSGTVGDERRPISIGQLAVFGDGGAINVSADTAQESRTPELDVLVLGGRPIGEPVYQYGPFVMNTKEEIAQAFEDYQAGRLGKVPAEHIGS
jgi:redox-sensitive bicupin YhaK (pirin superfamily)